MPIFQIDFELLSDLSQIETIGKIKNPAFKAYLNQQYGRANWLYKKGIAKIKVKSDQTVWISEIHFCEAHGKIKCHYRVKYLLERIYE